MLEQTVFAHQTPYYGIGAVEDMIEYKCETEICCTRANEAGLVNSAMGTANIFGVFVKGNVTRMFDRDVGSYVNSNGKRTEAIEGHEVKEYKDLVPCGDTPYCEVWMIPQQIVGVWVKRGTKLSQRFLQKLRYPITIID